MESIENRVKNELATCLCVRVEELQADTRLIEDLGADSLDTVEIVMALEDEFDIEIPEEDEGKLKTVQQVVDYIAAKVPA